jgi:hypothetical protein
LNFALGIPRFADFARGILVDQLTPGVGIKTISWRPGVAVFAKKPL